MKKSKRHLLKLQKEELLKLVEENKKMGRTKGHTLEVMGVSRATFYRWAKKDNLNRNQTKKVTELTPEEKAMVEEIKKEKSHYRHRSIHGELLQQGIYISPTSIYQYLKSRKVDQKYFRRPSPFKEPQYEVIRRNLMWGSDWTKLKINYERWYLLTVIDFFSRLIVGWDISQTVTAYHIKRLYENALKNQGIALYPKSSPKPELRVDRGSANTSTVTQYFFDELGAELSFARVRRPTDNAITERFYGTIKQEEIYLVGSYPDEISAKEEIGKYIEHYNTRRPHQALWNFTPKQIYEINNKSEVLKKLAEIKKETLQKRQLYWQNINQNRLQNNQILSHY